MGGTKGLQPAFLMSSAGVRLSKRLILKVLEISRFYYSYRASLVAQLAKNLRTVQETRVRSLGQEDPLKKEISIHFSILAWRIPWTEESGG